MTRVTTSCERISSEGAHPGYIGGILLEKFYNRGWVDYVLMVLTQRSARGSYAAQE